MPPVESASIHSYRAMHQSHLRLDCRRTKLPPVFSRAAEPESPLGPAHFELQPERAHCVGIASTHKRPPELRKTQMRFLQPGPSSLVTYRNDGDSEIKRLRESAMPDADGGAIVAEVTRMREDRDEPP